MQQLGTVGPGDFDPHAIRPVGQSDVRGNRLKVARRVHGIPQVEALENRVFHAVTTLHADEGRTLPLGERRRRDVHSKTAGSAAIVSQLLVVSAATTGRVSSAWLTNEHEALLATSRRACSGLSERDQEQVLHDLLAAMSSEGTRQPRLAPAPGGGATR